MKEHSEEFARYREAEADGRLIVRPDCATCKYNLQHYSHSPCVDCLGQDAIGEKGYYHDAINES